MNSRHRRALARPAASIALAVLGVVLILPAIVANWARDEIYDSERFADHATAALEESPVRDAIARELTAQIIAAGPPEVVSARPLIEFVAETVIQTRVFIDVWREAVEDLHRSVFERGDGETLTLAMVDGAIVITAFLEQAYPEIAEQLPANLNATFINVRDRDWSVQLVTQAEHVEQAAIILPFASLLLFAAAFAVGTDWRRTLMAIGIGCVAVAITLVVGRDYLRDIVVDAMPFERRDVAGAVWDAYTGSLSGWAMLTGVAGVIATLFGSGIVRRVEPRVQLDLAWQAICYTPEHVALKGARAAGFAVLGVVIIREPDQALQLAALGFGAYLLYFGVSELVWLAWPEPVTAEERERRRAASEGYGWIARRVAALAGILVIASLIGFTTYEAFQSPATPATAAASISKCNGYEELCDRRLNEVVFLGTHNSMSAASEPGWYMAEQLYGINTQLESGVRALLIDTWYGYESPRGVRTDQRGLISSALSEDQYSPEVVEAANRFARFIGAVGDSDLRGTFLCHAYCELGATPLVEAFDGIRRFVEKNQNEVLIIFIQDQISPEDTAKAMIASGLVKHVYLPQPGQPLPTLREMIDRDERVVVLAEQDSGNIDWYLQGFDWVQETPFLARTPADFSCAPNRGDADNPLFQLNHWITPARGVPTTRDAEIVNSFDVLYNRVRQCEAERGAKVNLVNVNFSEVGDARLVVDVLNGVAEPPGTATPDDATDGEADPTT